MSPYKKEPYCLSMEKNPSASLCILKLSLLKRILFHSMVNNLSPLQFHPLPFHHVLQPNAAFSVVQLFRESPKAPKNGEDILKLWEMYSGKSVLQTRSFWHPLLPSLKNFLLLLSVFHSIPHYWQRLIVLSSSYATGIKMTHSLEMDVHCSSDSSAFLT